MSKKTIESTIGSERMKAVESAMAQIEKAHGKGSIMTLGDKPVERIPVIPSGSIQIDMALGVGGFARGRIVEIYGPESSGKTTLTLHAIAEAQKAGGIAAFIDAEHAFDAHYARKLGVNIEQLLISQPESGEQALDIVETLVRSGALDIIVIDSVAALVPKAEIDGEMGDSHMGLQARLMSQALRKLTGIISKTRTSLIFINQLRMKIGVMFGNPETTTGGNALKFYASQRIDIRKSGNLKDGEDIVGSKAKIKVVKNKLAAPFMECEVDILYGQGISREGSIIDLGVELDILQKSGSWFSYGSERIGQGRENCRKFLRENPQLATDIESKIREKMDELDTFLLEGGDRLAADAIEL